jgi:hypothetical protein
VKLLLENWRKYLKEAHGLKTTWDDVRIDAVFKIIGRSCEEDRKCKPMPASKLRQKLKNKPSVNLDSKRVEAADIRYPLIVVVDNGEYQYIMDGNHRFAQAEQKDKIVQVKELYMDEYNQLFGGTE